MTYEELYKKVEGIWHDYFKSPEMIALFNIVKLHYPFDLPHDYDEKGCYGCGHIYPCATILEIEKGLNYYEKSGEYENKNL